MSLARVGGRGSGSISHPFERILVAVLDVPENISYYQVVRGLNHSPYPELLTSCVAIRTAIFMAVLAFLGLAILRRVASR